MNKLFELGIVGIFAGGLLAGCGTSQANSKEVKVKETKETKTVSAATEINPKEWKDKSSANGLKKLDFTPTAKGWVTEQLNIFRQPPDSKLLQAGYDKGYDYYLKADGVSRVLGSYIRVEGVDLGKDFENLRLLGGIIKHETDLRSDGTGSQKKWKPISHRLQLAYDYMTELLNDLDVAINKDGKGKTFGVSHQLGGDKVKELDSFISGG